VFIQKPTTQPERLSVSVVICCHNSEKLLPATLARLKEQQAGDVKWEVLVIDNASVDQTALVARDFWGEDGPALMRVVHEPRLGLCYARERAFAEAAYELLSFIDDDNWVGPDWVATVSERMSADPDLGAMGSVNIAVADIPFPEWFTRYCQYYAAWAYRESAALAAWVLNGAGMTIRKTAWRELKQQGFAPQLTGRVGSRLTTGEDLELGFALQLSGHVIQVEPTLRLEHYMTPGRLKWSYLRRLLRGIGEASVILDGYSLVSQSVQPKLVNRLRRCWWMRIGKEATQLLYSYSFVKLVKSRFRDMEGDDEVAQIEIRIGRLLALSRLRASYEAFRRDLADAPWRKTDHLLEGSTPDCSDTADLKDAKALLAELSNSA
jgi:glycosyltransferase involved in cell wall biosynthesis